MTTPPATQAQWDAQVLRMAAEVVQRTSRKPRNFPLRVLVYLLLGAASGIERDDDGSPVVISRGLRSRGMATGAFASPWRIDDDGRECSQCTRYKDWEQFAPAGARQPYGRQSACRECRRAKYETKHHPDDHRPLVLRKFGLTVEDYAWLFEQQGGKCALCLRPESKKDYRTGIVWWLSVDHDHSCHPKLHGCKQCIRGLLCADCNMLLGLAERVGGPIVVLFSEYLERRPFL